MAQTHVLVLQGPLEITGIDPVLQHMYPDTLNRSHVWVKYDCRTNIRYLSMAFRAKGFKICYSGWNEDREWLEANRECFDYLAISDQSDLRSHSIRNGVYISNNKEKMFYAAQAGLEAVAAQEEPDTVIFRLRSDVAINQELVAQEVTRVQPGSGLILVEYLNLDNILLIPDFMIVGELSTLLPLYNDLTERCRTNTSYHISAHIDIGITLVKMKLSGAAQAVQCMSKACFDSSVWKGVPRYFEYMYRSEHRFFDGGLSVPEGFDVDAILAQIPEANRGAEPQ